MKKLIPLPNSKSIIIRQLVRDFVLTGNVLPIEKDESNDVVVTYRALLSMLTPAQTVIDVEDCGAAYRFMMALLAVMPGTWVLTGTPRLLQRPIDELVGVLRSIGAEISRVENGWRIIGKRLSATELSVDCRKTSQYASALLLIAPKIGLKTLHLAPASIGSVSYIQLTQLITQKAVKIPELPSCPSHLGGVGDWSAALFWYAKALLTPGSEYELLNLSLASAQADSVIAKWFAEMGVVSTETAQGVLVTAKSCASARNPRVFDVADNPDVVPVMAALACLLPADFTFVHTKNLAYKESNRLTDLAEQLSRFAEVEIEEDMLRVMGRPRICWPKPPYKFHSYHDHRLVMGFLLFDAMCCIEDTSCLRKSYPELLNFC